MNSLPFVRLQVCLHNWQNGQRGSELQRFLHCSAGTLVAKGSYGAVTVTTNGAGSTFVTGGTIGRVTASASGVGRIVIDPTNRDASSNAHPMSTGLTWHGPFQKALVAKM